ncbi:MAG TPA: EamA family transporter [Acidobacteriaceae bacterium]|nr:EamA family transporter [Acidobacteriaceae bacterium]
MKHRLKPQQYLILIAIMLTASVGDSLLSRGMEQVGAVDVHHLGLLWHALFNPYVDAGIVLLIGFFASYITALSWADLTFVMPATAFGYVVVAFLARYWRHEHLSVYRWAGILLIVCAVGFVANGPSRTEIPGEECPTHSDLNLMDSGAGR